MLSLVFKLYSSLFSISAVALVQDRVEYVNTAAGEGYYVDLPNMRQGFLTLHTMHSDHCDLLQVEILESVCDNVRYRVSRSCSTTPPRLQARLLVVKTIS